MVLERTSKENLQNEFKMGSKIDSWGYLLLK
jgi:hypothetical protein